MNIANKIAVTLVSVFALLLLICFALSLWALIAYATTRESACCMPDECSAASSSASSSSSSSSASSATSSEMHSLALGIITVNDVPHSREICNFDNVLAARLSAGCRAFYERYRTVAAVSAATSSPSYYSSTTTTTHASAYSNQNSSSSSSSSSSLLCTTTVPDVCRTVSDQSGLRLAIASAVLSLAATIGLFAVVVMRLQTGKTIIAARERDSSSSSAAAAAGISSATGGTTKHQQMKQEKSQQQQRNEEGEEMVVCAKFHRLPTFLLPLFTLLLVVAFGLAIAALNEKASGTVVITTAAATAFTASCGTSLASRSPLLVSVTAPSVVAPLVVAGIAANGLVFFSILLAAFCCSSEVGDPVTVVALLRANDWSEEKQHVALQRLEEQKNIEKREAMRTAADARLVAEGILPATTGSSFDNQQQQLSSDPYLNGGFGSSAADALRKKNKPTHYYRDYEDSLLDADSVGRLSPVPIKAVVAGAGAGGREAASSNPLFGTNNKVTSGFLREGSGSASDSTSVAAGTSDSPMIVLRKPDGSVVRVSAAIPLEGKLDRRLLARDIHMSDTEFSGGGTDSEGNNNSNNNNSAMMISRREASLLLARAGGSPDIFSVQQPRIPLLGVAGALEQQRQQQQPQHLSVPLRGSAESFDSFSSVDHSSDANHRNTLSQQAAAGAAAGANGTGVAAAPAAEVGVGTDISRREFRYTGSLKPSSSPKAAHFTAPPSPAQHHQPLEHPMIQHVVDDAAQQRRHDSFDDFL